MPTEKMTREIVIPEAITIQELANRMAERAADIIEEMEPAEAADVLDELEEETSDAILEEMEPAEKTEVEDALDLLADHFLRGERRLEVRFDDRLAALDRRADRGA